MIRYQQTRKELEKDLNQELKSLLAVPLSGPQVVELLLKVYDKGYDEGAMFVLDNFADFGHTMVQRFMDEHEKRGA